MTKKKTEPAKGISTAKPALPAAAEAAKHVPRVPKVNAGNIEYDPEKINEVLANFEKFASEAEVKVKKTKVPKTEKPIARNIIIKLFPHIKVLIDKGYSKKEMYELFKKQGIEINFAGFSTAINKQLKALKEAEAAAEAANAGVAIDMGEVTGDAEPRLTGENATEPTAEELAAEERVAETHPTI